MASKRACDLYGKDGDNCSTKDQLRQESIWKWEKPALTS